MTRKRQKYGSQGGADESQENIAQTHECEISEKIKDYLQDFLKEMRAEFKHVCSSNEEKLTKIKDELLGSLYELRGENDRLSKKVETQEKEIKDLKEEIVSLNKTNDLNREKIEENQQYGRRNNIKIYGLKEKERGENAEETMEVVVKLFNEKLGVKVEKQDIDVVHRIGRMEEGRYRTIVVRFVRRVVRAKVIEKRRQLKSSGVVIADDLSPNNAWKYRQLKETFGAKNVWSRDGKLFAVSTQGEKIAITTNNFQHVINKAAEDTQARQTGQHESTASQGFRGYGRGRGRFNRDDVSF